MKIKTKKDIKKYRDKLNMTQKELSEATGIHIPDISNLENGRGQLWPDWKKRIEKVFNNKLKEDKNAD